MPNIKPISDLSNYAEVLKEVDTGNRVYLTKNGYGAMVVLSLDAYSRMTEPEEYIMDVADASAASTDLRFTHDEVFGSIREKINA